MKVILDGPDVWAYGRVTNGYRVPVQTRLQQGGGGVLLWAGITNDELDGPFQVEDGLKINSQTCDQFLEDTFYFFLSCGTGRTQQHWRTLWPLCRIMRHNRYAPMSCMFWFYSLQRTHFFFLLEFNAICFHMTDDFGWIVFSVSAMFQMFFPLKVT